MVETQINEDDYTNFLQDQVRRLNAILHEYQKRYLPVKEPSWKNEGPLPPWLTNPSVLSPLLLEYDNNIKTLKEQISFYKTEFDTLKDKADRIVQENTRLHGELRQNIESQLETARRGDGGGGHVLESEILDNLQRQLNILSQEKDNYVNLWENSSVELQRLQNLIKEKNQELVSKASEVAAMQEDLQRARNFAEELQNLNKKLRGEHDQFLYTAQTQDRETDAVREELRRCKSELKAAKSQNEELKRTMERLNTQLKIREKERIAVGQDSSAESRLEELQMSVLEMEARLSSTLKDNMRLHAENSELEERLVILQKKSLEMEEREQEAVIHVRDSVQMVENAVLERDQAIIREKQKNQEVNRLQDVINKLLTEAGKKTRQEVDSVRNHYNKNLEKLMEEMHYLEMEGAERQAQLERSLREKAAVEKELEKLYQEGPSEVARAGMTMEEIQKRLAITERDLDESRMRADSLQTTMRRSQNKLEKDKQQLSEENEDLKQKIKRLQKDCEEVSDSRLKLIEEIDALKKELLTSRQAQAEAERRCTTEIASLQQQQKIRGEEFEKKLQNSEEFHKQAINELREMLNAQQRVGAKWKEESRTLTQKFDKTVQELRQEIARHKKKNDELNKLLLHSKEKTEDTDHHLQMSKTALNKVQRIAADAEARADSATAQVTTLLNREKQLLQERKLLNREIEKLKLERSRPSMNGRVFHEPPQRLSDLAHSHRAHAQDTLDMLSPRPEGDLDDFGNRDYRTSYRTDNRLAV